MATLTAKAGRIGLPTGASAKTIVPTAMPQPAAAAPAGGTGYVPPTALPTKGNVTGPYDAFRDKPPSGMSVAFWNDQLDAKNKWYSSLPAAQQKREQGYINAPKSAVPGILAEQAQTAYKNLSAGQRATYEQRDQTAAPGGYGDPNSPQAKQDSYTDQIVKLAEQGQAGNQSFVDQNITPLLANQAVAGQTAAKADQAGLAALTAARNKADTSQQAVINEQRANAGNYNTQGQTQFDSYKAQQDALSGQDQGTLADYLKATDPLMTQLQAHGSDPNDIAAQQAALQRAIGIAGGGLNYTAAQSSSNAADVARQQQGYGDLRGIGGGSLNYASQAARAFADPTDVANQRKALSDIQNEVATGGKEQQDALDTIKSRTGVAPTAQEALLYELNRRARESQDASSRAAVMNQQQARGLRSGGAELASMQQAGQQTAQDRLLADMAANAGAVQRAQSYTGMQSDLATAMRGNQQNALGLQGNMSTALRNAGFDEAYKRGVGADTASANNQSTQLAGYQGAANTANVMRGQSDTMNMFNTGQTNQASANNQQTMLGGAQLQAGQSNAIRSANDTISMYKDTFAQNEAKRVGDLSGARATQGLAATDQIGTRNSSTYKSGADVLDTNYKRDKDTTDIENNAITPAFTRDSDVAGAIANVGQRGFDRVGTEIGSATNVANTRSGAYSPDSLIKALQYATGGIVNKEDTDALGA